MTPDEINGFLVKECGLDLDTVYGLSQWEKMIVLGYRPRVPRDALLARQPEKPSHLKRPAPFFRGNLKRG